MSMSHVGLSYNYRSQERNGENCRLRLTESRAWTYNSQNLEGVSLYLFCGFVVWLQDGQTNQPNVIKQVVPSVLEKAIDTIPSSVHTMPQNEGVFHPAISICLNVQLRSKSLLSVFSYEFNSDLFLTLLTAKNTQQRVTRWLVNNEHYMWPNLRYYPGTSMKEMRQHVSSVKVTDHRTEIRALALIRTDQKCYSPHSYDR